METDDEKDALEFNDLETDERINIDIVHFDMCFPDPKDYCIGFLVKELSNERRKGSGNLEEEKIGAESYMNGGADGHPSSRYNENQSSDVALHGYKGGDHS